MELLEAKKELEQLSASIGPVDSEYLKEHEPENYKLNQAIDTVLKALEKYEKQLDLDYVDKNYISKEYHELMIKEQNDIINDLKNRLDNSISKDEIRKKIEELEENNLEIDFSWDSDDVIIAKRMAIGKLEGFKELLGE